VGLVIGPGLVIRPQCIRKVIETKLVLLVTLKLTSNEGSDLKY
jgi:hypothetical protein